MMKITELVRTCYACPSQWEGRTACGHPIYIRYRWGRLSVRIGLIGESEWGAVEGQEIIGLPIGDGMDGFMEYQTLKGILEAPERWIKISIPEFEIIKEAEDGSI